MGLFDAMDTSKNAMSVHRFRVEVAAQNVANVYTPGYARQVVHLKAGNFERELDEAVNAAVSPKSRRGGAEAASDGADAVQVASITRTSTGPDGIRQEALRATSDMMQAKSAFELNMRATTLIKSMIQATLEINRQ